MRSFIAIVGGHRYAIEASLVRSVHPLVNAQPVPGVPPFVTGVIDVHGTLIPLVDGARLLLGAGSVAATRGARILVLRGSLTQDGGDRDASYALSVDALEGDTVDTPEGSWGAGPGHAPWVGAVERVGGNAVGRFLPRALACAHPQLTAAAEKTVADGALARIGE